MNSAFASVPIMNRSGKFRLLVLLSFAMLLLSAAAPGFGAKTVTGLPDSIGQPPIQYTPTEGDIWKESTAALPAYPVDGDLVGLAPLAGDTLHVFVDRKSVTRAADGVLRFTLVLQTGSGVRNVFYDGLRCETREYKTYAYGSTDRVLTASTNASWQPIVYLPINAFRFRLRADYACDGTGRARSPEEFLTELQHDR
jgi:hypothetical protein